MKINKFKFKIGDEVKIIGQNFHRPPTFTGHIGKIESIYPETDSVGTRYQLDNIPDTVAQRFYEEDLELIK